MKAQRQDLADLRKFYTTHAEQVKVEGVADTVAVGYVREYAGKISYVMFYGKQSKPKMHYAARTRELATKRVTEALTAAGQSAQRRAEERKQPRQAYHDSKPNEAGIITRSYTTAGTAQLIREALKANFPGVKFSVRSSEFANGSAVDIEYIDGPSEKQVKAVYARFISGHFDSMQDMHTYHENATVIGAGGELRRESYGAKYISTRRDYSPAYGFFLNSLDLREQPTLAAQFAAFEYWHRSQRYNMRTSFGYVQSAGAWEVSSDSSHGDLEKFAAALTAQGYAPQLIDQDGLTLRVVGPDDRQPEPDEQPAPVVAAAIEAAATVEAPQVQEVPELDQTASEFMAAELSWLSDPGQDSTDREFMAAELSWLAS